MDPEAECKCNVCSALIIFPGRHAGGTTECPHCQMPTVLYLPPDTRISAHQSITAQPATNPDVIYAQGTVTITRALLRVGTTSIPLTAINSFQTIQLPANRAVFQLITIGIFGTGLLGLAILGVNSSSDQPNKGATIVAGLFLTVAGLLVLLRLIGELHPGLRRGFQGPPQYALSIRTLAGEQNILTSPDITTLSTIETALHRAITSQSDRKGAPAPFTPIGGQTHLN